MKIIDAKTNKEIKHTVIGFSGGERHVQLGGITSIDIKEVILRANVNNSEQLVDVLLIENALRHKYGNGLKVHLELPYLPYARQDRVCAPGQAFSLEVFANLLKMLRLTTLVTWDCHSHVGIELTGAKNIAPVDIIRADKELTNLLLDKNTVLICPDKGAVSRCDDIKDKLSLESIVYCEKKRDPATGKIYKTDVLVDDLTGKCAVISDDICDGGYTFIKIAEQLKEKNVDKVVLFVTHGIFSKGLDVFDGLIDQVITTNSFNQQQHAKLNVINFEYNFTNGAGE